MTTAHKSTKTPGRSKAGKSVMTQDRPSSRNAPRLPEEKGSRRPQDIKAGYQAAITPIECYIVHHSKALGVASLLGTNPEGFVLTNVSYTLGLRDWSAGFGMVVQPASVISRTALPAAENPVSFQALMAGDVPAEGRQDDGDEPRQMFNVQVQVPVPDQSKRLGLDIEQAVEEWARMLPLFIANSLTAQEGALQRAAQAYQPQTQLRPIDLELLEMQKNAAESILSGARWMTAAEVSQEANRSKSNPHALANRWKKEGRVFAIRYQGVERYPRYAFDEHMTPLPIIGEVLPYFALDADGAEVDPWNIAAWFESANAYLDSAQPRERLDNPEMIRFAIKNLNNMMHG